MVVWFQFSMILHSFPQNKQENACTVCLASIIYWTICVHDVHLSDLTGGRPDQYTGLHIKPSYRCNQVEILPVSHINLTDPGRAGGTVCFSGVS